MVHMRRAIAAIRFARRLQVPFYDFLIHPLKCLNGYVSRMCNDFNFVITSWRLSSKWKSQWGPYTFTADELNGCPSSCSDDVNSPRIPSFVARNETYVLCCIHRLWKSVHGARMVFSGAISTWSVQSSAKAAIHVHIIYTAFYSFPSTIPRTPSLKNNLFILDVEAFPEKYTLTPGTGYHSCVSDNNFLQALRSWRRMVETKRALFSYLCHRTGTISNEI